MFLQLLEVCGINSCGVVYCSQDFEADTSGGFCMMYSMMVCWMLTELYYPSQSIIRAVSVLVPNAVDNIFQTGIAMNPCLCPFQYARMRNPSAVDKLRPTDCLTPVIVLDRVVKYMMEFPVSQIQPNGVRRLTKTDIPFFGLAFGDYIFLDLRLLTLTLQYRVSKTVLSV